MKLLNQNLCDFCFYPIEEGTVCPRCGLTHETYQADAGLLLPGANLMGKYIIGRVLGRGGFGATYLAYSIDQKAPVAIKEYFPIGIAYRGKGEAALAVIADDKRDVFQKGAKRFFDEAKTISQFNQIKNIVHVFEFWSANNTVYYAMEYLDGVDLKTYIKNKGGRLSEAEVVTVWKGVCEGLMMVHSTQTLHRDISPDNIIICKNGDVKLIDFGAAKQFIGNSQQAYSVVVKQGFAPIEQYRSDGNQGAWTDIYATGASMYYALTGVVPTDAINRMDNPNVPFDPNLNISDMMKNIINRCLQIKIEFRFQSAIELLGALNNLNIAPVSLAFSSGYDEPATGGPSTGAGAMDQPTQGIQDVKFDVPPANAPQHKKKKMPLIIGGATGAVAVIVLCIVLAVSGGKSSESVGGGGSSGGTANPPLVINTAQQTTNTPQSTDAFAGEQSEEMAIPETDAQVQMEESSVQNDAEEREAAEAEDQAKADAKKKQDQKKKQQQQQQQKQQQQQQQQAKADAQAKANADAQAKAQAKAKADADAKAAAEAKAQAEAAKAQAEAAKAQAEAAKAQAEAEAAARAAAEQAMIQQQLEAFKQQDQTDDFSVYY